MQPIDKNQLLSDAYQFMQEQSLGVISTVSSDNSPQSACVNYLLDNEWKIFIITNKDSRKVKNIAKNNHVSFVVGIANIPHTVQIQADAQIIELGSEEYEVALKKLNESQRLNKDPIYSAFGNNYVILKLQITWLRWLYFDRGTGNEVYSVLIP